MSTESQLRERLLKIEALFAGANTSRRSYSGRGPLLETGAGLRNGRDGRSPAVRLFRLKGRSPPFADIQTAPLSGGCSFCLRRFAAHIARADCGM